MKRKTNLLVLTIFLSVSSLFSQVMNNPFSKTFEFVEEMVTEEFSISIDTANTQLRIDINGKLHSGDMMIEIINPNKKILEKLILETNDEEGYFNKKNVTCMDSSKTVILSETTTLVKKGTSAYWLDEDPNIVNGTINKIIYFPVAGWWTVKMTPQSAEALIKVKYILN